MKGLVSKAKSKIEQVTEKVPASSSSDDVKNVASQARSATALTKGRPELPWLMNINEAYREVPNAEGNPVQRINLFFNTLDEQSEADVRDLAAKMKARHESNKLMEDAEGVGDEERLFSEARGHCSPTLRFQQGTLYENADGSYYCVDKNVTLFAWRISGTYIAKNDDGKWCFVDQAKRGTFVDDDERLNKEVNETRNYVILAEALFDMDDKDDCKDLFRWRYYQKALAEAASGNAPENIERKALPAAGSMNGQLSSQALTLAKRTFADAVSVRITSNSWEVRRNALGVVTQRYVNAWVVRQTKNGKMAYSRSFYQEAMGGGKFGALKMGGASTATPFYVQ